MDYYVHGYSSREAERLNDQAGTLSELLHHDSFFPAGSKVLEPGCGIGSQTVILAQKSPQAHFVSIDKSASSLEIAAQALKEKQIKNVTLQQADLFDLPFEDKSFEHLFICFVLEHLSDPLQALKSLKRVLKPGGSLTVIEGDHGSFLCYPQTREALLSVECLIKVQAAMNGNSLIGRQLYPLISEAGFNDITVSPRMVYVDSSRPRWVEGFSKNTFIAMVEGVKEQALEMNLVDEDTWEKGIQDLYRATKSDGTFCYTFFKATAIFT